MTSLHFNWASETAACPSVSELNGVKVSPGGILVGRPPTPQTTRTLTAAPVAPGRTATIEGFNVRLRDHLLAGEIFFSREEPDSLYGRPTAGRLP